MSADPPLRVEFPTEQQYQSVISQVLFSLVSLFFLEVLKTMIKKIFNIPTVNLKFNLVM